VAGLERPGLFSFLRGLGKKEIENVLYD